MDANRRLVDAGHGADIARRVIAVVAEHEHRALTPFEPIDRCGETPASLASQQPLLGVEMASTGEAGCFGKTREEALVNISEAIALCLESGDKPSGELVDVTVAA